MTIGELMWWFMDESIQIVSVFDAQEEEVIAEDYFDEIRYNKYKGTVIEDWEISTIDCLNGSEVLTVNIDSATTDCCGM